MTFLKLLFSVYDNERLTIVIQDVNHDFDYYFNCVCNFCVPPFQFDWKHNWGDGPKFHRLRIDIEHLDLSKFCGKSFDFLLLVYSMIINLSQK